MTQPPERKGAYLLDSLVALRERAESCQPVTIAPAMPASTCDRYGQAVHAWLSTLTPAQRLRTFTIGEVVKLAGLHGCNGKGAAPQWVGYALHQAGFKSVRDWTVAGRNKRFWKLVKD